MTTETEIAKENLKSYKLNREYNQGNIVFYQCEEHKESCERFLEFLGWKGIYHKYDKSNNELHNLIENKITELKNTIKLYEENKI